MEHVYNCKLAQGAPQMDHVCNQYELIYFQVLSVNMWVDLFPGVVGQCGAMDVIREHPCLGGQDSPEICILNIIFDGQKILVVNFYIFGSLQYDLSI